MRCCGGTGLQPLVFEKVKGAVYDIDKNEVKYTQNREVTTDGIDLLWVSFHPPWAYLPPS